MWGYTLHASAFGRGGSPSYFNDIKLYILHVILFVHVPLFKKKTLLGNQGPTLHPFGPFAVYTGSGQFREKTLVGFYTKSSSMSDNSIYARFGIGLDNPT